MPKLTDVDGRRRPRFIGVARRYGCFSATPPSIVCKSQSIGTHGTAHSNIDPPFVSVSVQSRAVSPPPRNSPHGEPVHRWEDFTTSRSGFLAKL